MWYPLLEGEGEAQRSILEVSPMGGKQILVEYHGPKYYLQGIPILQNGDLVAEGLAAVSCPACETEITTQVTNASKIMHDCPESRAQLDRSRLEWHVGLQSGATPESLAP